MRHKIYFLSLLAGMVGIAAGNPDCAGAQSPHKEIAEIRDASPTHVGAIVDEHNSFIIEIYKMKFQSKIMSVRIGDKVTWINRDIVPHTATAIDKSWDSGQLKAGEKYTLTITSQTGLDYFCLYHRQMKAKLVLDKSH